MSHCNRDHHKSVAAPVESDQADKFHQVAVTVDKAWESLISLAEARQNPSVFNSRGNTATQNTWSFCQAAELFDRALQRPPAFTRRGDTATIKNYKFN